MVAGLLAALAACGGETPDAPADAAPPGADAIPPAERYLPLAMGASWTWTVTPTAPAAPYQKTSSVEAFEDIGGSKAGIMAFRVRTIGDDGVTVSWQEDTGSRILRHREQTFSVGQVLLSDQVYVPHKLRLDESNDHIVLGASFTETYTEIETDPTTGATMTSAKSETWTVEAVDEPVTVPAGPYDCVRVRRIGNSGAASDKLFWFAKGVGKIKETGNQTEELMSYTPGAP